MIGIVAAMDAEIREFEKRMDLVNHIRRQLRDAH